MSPKVTFENEVEVTSSSPDDARLKKRWGYVAALPSEYLIHFRKGRLHEKTSGQGASCFKGWNDTTFIIPTSLKEIIFEANQLTKDNVDVRIRGMTVYRIADPLRIYKLINFSHRQSAEEKLARMIGDMCRSTAKWLVANMNVDECIRKRKEDIAEALKAEVSRVVADSEKGWGVEIMTIDIQDVYIQDHEIFEAMTMLFKADKNQESRLAQMEMERNVELKKLEQERELAEHRKTTELNQARLEADMQKEKLEMQKTLAVTKLQQERELAEHQKTTSLQKVQNEAEIKDEQIALTKQNETNQFTLDRYRVEQNEAIAQYKFEQEQERERQKMALHLENTQKDVEARTLIHHEEAAAMQMKIQAENGVSPANLEKQFLEKALPSLAEVMAKTMRDVKISMYQQEGEGNGSPLNFMLMEIMQIFKDRMEALSHKQGTEPQPTKTKGQ